ncbi:MAG: ROK family protein [Victivallales bacterium]|nr:ROK family protein [Victivallales bacterium]
MLSTRVKIIDAIRIGKNNFSKKDVCTHSGVSWGAMYKIVDTLLAEGVVFTRNEKPIGRGRPNVPLCINPAAACYCGIDIGAHSTKILFVDLNFNILYQEKVETLFYSDEENFFKWLAECFRNTQMHSGIADDKINAVGLSISGTVDSEHGIIVSGANWGMTRGANLPVTKLASAIRHPVCVYSTQVAAVLAEYHFGKEAGRGNLVTIGLGVGIGSGAIANHMLLVSHPSRLVGYIGHILIPGNDRDCVCGWHGCLEAYSGGDSLLKAIASRTDIRSAKDIDLAAASGDPVAIEIMDTAARYNAIGVAGMIQLYSPEAVIFSGGQVRREGYLYRQTLVELKKLLPPNRRDCIFDITKLGEFQSALGAARLAFEKFF